ncbi:uncharacterized protein LOC126369962 [Pectinophora gossypiella]|uniref:uncharacterized protein LOC126369962 n=1 Tax=Pectinophora gossypiella TaxID=13191 RepID=UPI00214E8190|nr:uncharacterized protein LOC126369962 [Pectinophora gossypiella]
MMGDTRKNEDNPVPFEEALTKTGNGLYNILLVCTCALILLAIGVDLFGFSLVVTAACDLELTVSQKGILTSLPFIGILLVSYIWGYVSDTRGRRFTLVLSLQTGFILSCISCLSPNWLVLGIVKFFSVCFSCAANSATYTLVGEACIQRVRNKYMLLMTCLLLLSPAIAGVLTYPTLKLDFEVELYWLGLYFRPWRLLIIVLAIPSGIGGLLIMFFHESPKFLANLGRKDEALKVMKHMYAVNHRCSQDEYKIHSLTLEEVSSKKEQSLLRSMYEQSAPLFRRPLLWRTLQLFYIVFVVYITNNSFLVWLPHILNLVRVALESSNSDTANICALISTETAVNGAENVTAVNYTNTTVASITPDICLGTVEDNVILTLIASQSVFSFLNFAISYLPNRRKVMLICILCSSALSGICINLMPEPISSVFFFVVFTCTCLGMGMLASYFVDLYPTSYRGMVACLSIMVGRSSTFIGINLVGNLIFYHCQITFYLWSLLVLSSAVAAVFLPPDKPPMEATAL